MYATLATPAPVENTLRRRKRPGITPTGHDESASDEVGTSFDVAKQPR
ncbi:hypothetical protein [uncultured Hydrogenophaga sp.]|nr:hypothetical protein [uncultured Hydrogenophaga sp.]